MGRGDSERTVDEAVRFGLDGVLPDSELIEQRRREEHLHELIDRISPDSQRTLPLHFADDQVLCNALRDNDPPDLVDAYLRAAALSLSRTMGQSLQIRLQSFFSNCGLGRQFSPLVVAEGNLIHVRADGNTLVALCGKELDTRSQLLVRGAFKEAKAFSAGACKGCRAAADRLDQESPARRAADEGLDYLVISEEELAQMIEGGKELLRRQMLQTIADGTQRNLLDLRQQLLPFFDREAGKLAARYFNQLDPDKRYNAIFTLPSSGNGDADVCEALGRAAEVAYGSEVAQWPWPGEEQLAVSFAEAAGDRVGTGTIIRAGVAARVVADHLPKAIPVFEDWKVDPAKERQSAEVDRVLPILRRSSK